MLPTAAVKRTVSLLFIVLLALDYRVERVESANILGLFTTHSPSHLIVHMAIARTLAEAGHNVTVVSGLEIKNTHSNIKHIVIPPTEEHVEARNAMLSESAGTQMTIISILFNYVKSLKLRVNMELDLYTNEYFNQLYEPNNGQIDLVILGDYFNTYALGVAAKLKVPVIMSFSMPVSEMVNPYVGNPKQLAYVPIYNTDNDIRPGEVMSFKQRVINFRNALIMQALNGLFYIINWRIYNQLFAGDQMPSYSDMRNNISLIFCNGHFSEGPVRPNVPAIIEIGGIQIKEKSNALPQDLKRFINASGEHGTIYLSLGSNMQSAYIKPETAKALYNVLSGLKQHVIWKWDDLEHTPGNSSNIMYKSWLPQDDILAHPRVKLFITHAGKGGIMEAQHYGVPMVAMPIMYDQPANAKAMTLAGLGRQLNFVDITEESFRDVVSDVLTNATYTVNAQEFSKLYRDRPMTAKESVVYWTEYVIRHHGAAHLQSPFVHLNVIEAYNLDLVLVSILVRMALFRLIKKIFSACKRSIIDMRQTMKAKRE